MINKTSTREFLKENQLTRSLSLSIEGIEGALPSPHDNTDAPFAPFVPSEKGSTSLCSWPFISVMITEKTRKASVSHVAREAMGRWDKEVVDRN